MMSAYVRAKQASINRMPYMYAATLTQSATANVNSLAPAKVWQPVQAALLAQASRCVDTSAIAATGWVLAGASFGDSAVTAAALSAATAVAVTAVLRARGLYQLFILGTPRTVLAQIVSVWGVALIGLAVVLVAAGLISSVHAGWFGNFAFYGLAALMAARGTAAFATRALRAAGAFRCTTVIYGSGSAATILADALAADATSEIRVAGVFDDRLDDRSATAGAAPHLGSLADLKAYVRANKVDTIIMALPMGAEARVSGLVQRLADLPVDIRLAANASRLQFAPAAYSYIGTVPVIDLANRPISGFDAIAKRAFDVVIAAVALVALAPVMLVVAAAVRLESKGPALFRQKRYGFNNELIEVYKFRSMCTDRSDATASKLVTKNDPRVTRVGRIIRKSSLDELPQLFNVLLGNLSLVGPRPHAVHAKAADQLYPDVVATYFARHNVKPGITGWAQINGWRGETDTEEKIRQRVAFDLDYIKRWSVGFDLAILIKTPLSLLKTENAY
jgi:Undecaprenyl-phosphate glucose phosphotransferase